MFTRVRDLFDRTIQNDRKKDNSATSEYLKWLVRNEKTSEETGIDTRGERGVCTGHPVLSGMELRIYTLSDGTSGESQQLLSSVMMKMVWV